MSSKLTLEERVARLEKLFSFSDDSVSLSLNNGGNSVTLEAGKDSAFVSVAGKSNLVALHSEDAFGVISLYHKDKGEKPVLAFLVDEEGEVGVQHIKEGQAIKTEFGMVQTTDLEGDEPEANVRNRMEATHKPLG